MGCALESHVPPAAAFSPSCNACGPSTRAALRSTDTAVSSACCRRGRCTSWFASRQRRSCCSTTSRARIRGRWGTRCSAVCGPRSTFAAWPGRLTRSARSSVPEPVRPCSARRRPCLPSDIRGSTSCGVDAPRPSGSGSARRARSKPRLEIFESFLCERLAGAGAIAPLVADALVAFEAGDGVAEVVRRSGYSHRTFLTLFRDAVGLGPKAYGRVRRFQRAIEALGKDPRGLAHVAVEAGYADQSHLCRELVALAGVSPTAYLALAPAAANHVRVAR